MALGLRLYKTQQYFLIMFAGNKLPRTLFTTRQQERNCSMLLEVDNLDNFTTQLMQKKASNWEIMLARRRLLKDEPQFKKTVSANVVEYNILVNQLSTKELDNVVKDAIESSNISLLSYIVNKCVDCSKLPSVMVLLEVLSVFSLAGDKNSILSMVHLCEKLQPSIVDANSGFRHYLAEATWIKGNVSEAVTIFEEVYRNNIYLRRRIRCMIKMLILTVVPNRSEAAVITICNFVERIAHNFNDFIPLAQLWRVCFLSEWYLDQCLAFDLLQRHSNLYEILSSNLTQIVAVALKSNRTEVVYRLLEELLLLKRKPYYVKVLEVLFDHRVNQGDLRSCSEIMQWTLDNDVDLPALQQQKFADLLILYKVDMCLKTVRKKQPVNSGTLKYKF